MYVCVCVCLCRCVLVCVKRRVRVGVGGVGGENLGRTNTKIFIDIHVRMCARVREPASPARAGAVVPRRARARSSWRDFDHLSLFIFDPRPGNSGAPQRERVRKLKTTSHLLRLGGFFFFLDTT